MFGRLMDAIKGGQTLAIAEVLRAGVDLADEGRLGHTPLQLAFFDAPLQSREQVVKLLLEAGADPTKCYLGGDKYTEAGELVIRYRKRVWDTVYNSLTPQDRARVVAAERNCDPRDEVDDFSRANAKYNGLIRELGLPSIYD